jgi:DNA (cytosine-5)-methyltransferase 1
MGELVLTYGSVCSGIEAATVAWHPLGWRCAFVSEIEAFPRAVLQHRWPEIPLHGDFTTIEAGEYAPIDVLVGGTPCQSFSVAGLRGGLDDERGNLALEYLRLADRLRPRWLVWENVPGVLSSAGGRDFGSILGGLVELGYGFAYRVLDAQFFGVAQRRRRVFVVGHLGDWRRAAAVLFERHSLQGHPSPRREAGERAAPCLASRSSAGGGLGTDHDLNGGLIVFKGGQGDKAGGLALSEHVSPTLGSADSGSNRAPVVAYGGNNTSGPIDVAASLAAHGGPKGRMDFASETFVTVAPCLDASFGRLHGQDDQHIDSGAGLFALSPVAFTCSAMANGFALERPFAPTLDAQVPNDSSNIQKGVRIGSAVRRLTPRECERLQGFPDDYTLIPWRKGMAPDGPRYKALGNSMAVPVMRWIGERIRLVESLSGRRAERPQTGNSGTNPESEAA